MASTPSSGQLTTVLPTNFFSLPPEIRQEILLSLIDPPPQDLSPESGNYENGRDGRWFDEFCMLSEEIKRLSADLKKATGDLRLRSDIEYMEGKRNAKLRELSEAWLQKAYEDGEENWKDAEGWDECAAPDPQTNAINACTNSLDRGESHDSDGSGNRSC